DENTTTFEQQMWQDVHAKKKYVFSSHNKPYDDATVISTDIADTVNEIKKQDGKDIWLYGGAGLIRTFVELGLIDQYQLAVHPIVLGSGKPLFENLKERI